MNIGVAKLEAVFKAHDEYGFICDIDGKQKCYKVAATKLLKAFQDNEVVRLSSGTLRWSFYFEHDTGKIYSTVSAANTHVIIECEPCTCLQPDITSAQDEIDLSNGKINLVLQELGIEPCIDSANTKQIENQNYYYLAYLLSRYGFECARLNDDAKGADLCAHHSGTGQMLAIQLKGCSITIAKKYQGKDIYMAMFDKERNLYLIPHDKLMGLVPESWQQSDTWEKRGAYQTTKWSKEMKNKLAPYVITLIE